MQNNNEIQKSGINADHDRRKKQATIDFYSYIYQLRIPFQEEIDKVAGRGEPISSQMIIDNPALRKHLGKYLSLMERLAVGIHADVYDLDIFSAMASQVTINIYHRCVQYIQEARQKNNNPDLYIEFETLILKLETLKKGQITTTAESAKIKVL